MAPRSFSPVAPSTSPRWKTLSSHAVLLATAALALASTTACETIGQRTLIAANDVLNNNAGLTEKRLQVAGHNVVYLEGGSGSPLLILHGFSAQKEHFSLMATSLVNHHRVFIPDVPGFGESSYDPAKSYDPESQAERLIAFANAAGLDRFAVVGNSMGGHLATIIAAKIPDRVTHVVLLSPAGVIGPEKSAFLRLLESGTNPFDMKTDADAARLLDLQFHVPPDAIGPVRPALYQQLKRRGPRNASIFRDYALREPFDSTEVLAKVVAPTLILWGEYDQMLDKSAGPLFVEKMPRATLIPLENCGHLPQLERPTETAAHILRFLSSKAAP